MFVFAMGGSGGGSAEEPVYRNENGCAGSRYKPTHKIAGLKPAEPAPNQRSYKGAGYTQKDANQQSPGVPAGQSEPRQRADRYANQHLHEVLGHPAASWLFPTSVLNLDASFLRVFFGFVKTQRKTDREGEPQRPSTTDEYFAEKWNVAGMNGTLEMTKGKTGTEEKRQRYNVGAARLRRSGQPLSACTSGTASPAPSDPTS